MKVLALLLFGIVSLYACDTPFMLTKFHSILEQSKLQAPESAYNARFSVKYGNFQDVCNQFFYLQDRKYMAFEMCGKKKRSELRLQKEWRVETAKKKRLFAKVKIFPLDQEKEFTFLQIHANSNRKGINGKKINKPLLRLTWWKEQKNRHDHLWAVIRTSGDVNEQKYIKIDLGLRPKNFFTTTIEVKKNIMKIFVNSQMKIKMNVDYWQGYWNYFKIGVYNQGDGCSKAIFDRLEVE